MEQLREILLIILINLACVHCVPKCCNVGENAVVSSTTCLNGDLLKMDSCKVRFFIDEKDQRSSIITVDEDENLVIDGKHLAAKQEYCFTKLRPYDENVYVVCMTNELVHTSLESEVAMGSIIILQLMSVTFNIFTVIVYAILPQMMDLQGISIVHSITGLALGNATIVIINLSKYLPPVICHFLAYCVYTSFLYAFFWLNIICFHIWSQIVKPSVLSSVKRWSQIYHLYGIIGPLLCITILLIMHHADIPFFKSIHPGIGELSCWFKSPREAFIYFYMPITILISINLVFFIWTSVVLWKQSKNCRKNKIMKFRVRMYIKLFVVMGITWIFEVIQTVIGHGHVRWLWYILDAVNASQGLIIFLVLVVFRKRVVRLLANKKIFSIMRLPTHCKYAEDSECEEQEVEEEELHNVYYSDANSSQRININDN